MSDASDRAEAEALLAALKSTQPMWDAFHARRQLEEAAPELLAVVTRLADWSRRWPNEEVYSYFDAVTRNEELYAIEEEAKRLCPNAKPTRPPWDEN